MEGVGRRKTPGSTGCADAAVKGRTLRSRWIMLLRWQWSTPERICVMHSLASWCAGKEARAVVA